MCKGEPHKLVTMVWLGLGPPWGRSVASHRFGPPASASPMSKIVHQQEILPEGWVPPRLILGGLVIRMVGSSASSTMRAVARNLIVVSPTQHRRRLCSAASPSIWRQLVPTTSGARHGNEDDNLNVVWTIIIMASVILIQSFLLHVFRFIGFDLSGAREQRRQQQRHHQCQHHRLHKPRLHHQLAAEHNRPESGPPPHVRAFPGKRPLSRHVRNADQGSTRWQELGSRPLQKDN